MNTPSPPTSAAASTPDCAASPALLRAVFLDRDGVINEDTGYIDSIEKFRFLPGVVADLRELRRRGFLLLIVTNQSGIGRGFYTYEDYERITAWMLAQLADGGVVIDGVYCCPHTPTAGCSCRKPAPGLILRAQQEHHVDLANSWLVGDKLSDIEAAHRAGVGSTLLLHHGSQVDAAPVKPLFVGTCLRDMIAHLES